ncbi:ankyrin repeat and MYND domain-containing protein 2-like [Teleopsis dalmanni]|uniref:ankyrin repeat and MYND domain-containing protein 2-like n=1 Tax=Teleopsis dalmanni TaxID=139649 RepID=UPI0018CD7F8B|nr:ankyrin repeat and MYND domain-containing protein 2-like [Teleopsis dalmanni]XP_037938006.1 ankyrin repeat and MYND domain-containing protein 2-like [Teleopsis dalmanni]XP_037938007.1 ankyrin repeat and MYND domain-containing protein 2-like [Teleopsis dalmanni]
MSQENQGNQLEEIQKQIFDAIAKNETNVFKQLITQAKGGVNFVDDGGMTPLQHACCKGNKEVVELLLDMGADINYNKHGANYTPLHFAALSGNTELCRLLLDAGINPSSLNSVSRTASQMAAFVGNHSCVEAINNYISKEQLKYYTVPQGQQTEPILPPSTLQSFHSFVIEVNLHPVRIALNLQSLGLIKYMSGLKRALELLSEKEMTKSHDVNELMAFKYHYLRWILSEIMRCEEQCKAQKKDKPVEADANKTDFIELFIKRALKENKSGQLDYIEYTIRDCTREFRFRETIIFRQIVSQLASKDALPALNVLRNNINGLRGFVEETSFCSSCGNEKPDKKCSKCRAVQYCDRECQRLHWFMHKKTCARPTSNATPTTASATKEPIDVSELREAIADVTAS